MANRPSADDFIIRVHPTCIFCNNALEIGIDLSDRRFESQVLAAAGRFNSLRRKSKSGGRGIIPVQCADCGEEVPTRKIAQHRKEHHDSRGSEKT